MAKKLIFYVDDEVDLCEMFVELFGSDRIEVRSFSQPQDALLATRKVRPDLIFLDYRLPRITGDELAPQFDQTIPKVLVTGDISLKVSYPFLKIFPKPFQIEEMEALIQEVLFSKS